MSPTPGTRDFLGIDADLWMAFGTILGPLVAVLLGLWIFRIQQQSQFASERFLSDGVQRLYGTLSTLLSIYLQNYQIGTYIIRTVQTYERGHPLTPGPDEVPKFIGLELDSLPIDSILPVQEIIGDSVVSEWVMLALSDVTLEAKEADFQVRQPTVAYYRSGVKVDTEEVTRRLLEVLEAWNERVSTHFALLDRLNDLSRHIATNRPWTVRGYYAMSRRGEVVEIREAMKTGLSRVHGAHEKTASVLRSGGTDAVVVDV